MSYQYTLLAALDVYIGFIFHPLYPSKPESGCNIYMHMDRSMHILLYIIQPSFAILLRPASLKEQVKFWET